MSPASARILGVVLSAANLNGGVRWSLLVRRRQRPMVDA